MNNFFKISFRRLMRSKLYSAINIAGLVVGITCMLLAVLYWKDEHSFDDFHVNNPNLYRVTTTLIENKAAQAQTVGGTGQVQGPAFKAAVPEVKSFVRILGGDIYSDVIANNRTIHLRPLFVDSNFFDVFSFHLLAGDAATVLTDINSVVVTESTARKFFNTVDVVGKLLKLDADPSFDRLGKAMIISGVVKDPSPNSSLQFDALFTFQFMRLSFEDANWLNAYLGTFVVLNGDADKQLVAQKFNNVFAVHAKEQRAENFKTYGYDPQISYGLQPITDIHLNALAPIGGNAEGGISNTSNVVYNYMFMAIAAFILLMAGINFINISIANSLKHSKEVGVRKIAGSSRGQIIAQFFRESAILCFIAFLLSMILMNAFLPLFNNLTGKQIIFSGVFDARLLIYFMLLLAVIILLTGFYPALVLSRFKPAEVLYGKQKLSGRNLLGRSLVVVQFALAVFLLIASMIYYRQMDYVETKELGYNPHQVIHTSITGNRNYKTLQAYFKNELARYPVIKGVAFGTNGNIYTDNVNGSTLQVVHKIIDENYLSTMEIPLKAGRNFSTAFASDRAGAVVVNEAFVKAAHLQNPIGTQIKTNDYPDGAVGTIVGVVKDFHFGSLREPIQPMAMLNKDWEGDGIWIKFQQGNQNEALAAIQKVYKEALPGTVFQYHFLDDLNARQYVQEQRWKQVISIATIFSFIVCCLGLFGLAHLSTHQRLKEIGVRKVVGASVSQIITILSVDFLKLVVVAFIIAVPVSWYVMDKWLQHFAYHTGLIWWVFAVAGLTAMLIALLTISFQGLRAAVANPVKSLRSE